MQRNEFIKVCYRYMKGKTTDLISIWNFIQENNIDWIESSELKKGIHVIDGELMIINLEENHIYIYDGIPEKVKYSSLRKT